MCNPPKLGDPSYPLFKKEKDAGDSFLHECIEFSVSSHSCYSIVLDSLKRRARLITDAFNSLEGVTCQETDGKVINCCIILLYMNSSLLNLSLKVRCIHSLV